MANKLARHLRKHQTVAERKLWPHLAALRPQGYHFRRQVPLDGYILDFACFSQRVVIEVDGVQHETPDARKADAQRDAHLHRHGFSVLRFTNSDVMDNIDGCIVDILAALGAVVRWE